MAKKQPRLAVVLADLAIDQLDEIWSWNLNRYGLEHADAYLAFLKTAIDKLDRTYSEGKIVPSRKGYRYVNLRKKNRGQGHVAVYRFNDVIVEILHVFHSAQNWQTHVSDDPA